MNLDFKYLLDGNFHPQSRVWIYQCNRLFSLKEALDIEIQLKEFVSDWMSHGIPVKGAGYLFFGQFIVLMADETATGVSGCSTDGSVRLIKKIEQDFNVNMFDRTMLAFYIKDKIELLPMNQLQYAMNNNFITAETFYFNNTVQTKKELEENWVTEIKNTWLSKKIFIDTL